METFLPEFSQYWLRGPDSRAENGSDQATDAARAEEQALEELAERVSAARSVV